MTMPQKGTKPKNKTGPPKDLSKMDKREAAKALVGITSTAMVINTITNLTISLYVRCNFKPVFKRQLFRP